MTTSIKTSKPGYLSGRTTITKPTGLTLYTHVDVVRIIDKENNVFSGEKNIVPGDIYITVNVNNSNPETLEKPIFRVFRVTGSCEDEIHLDSVSPALLAGEDILTNSKLYSIIEEAKFLYKKYAKR